MGLLTPLYALAAIAIVGPIIFHLIRRQPQGRLQFSSLMFLRTSPPRLTRRSRLDHLLLLLLRILALAMIALAFSRPYWRQKELVSQSAPNRTVVILIDTSASMQRAEVWQSALREATKVLSGLSAEDQVALYTIDSYLYSIVALDAASFASENSSSSALVTAALKTLKPTWKSGNLAAGLTGVAEQLSLRSLGAVNGPMTEAQIVLISDFHIESGIEGLQGYSWPTAISVDLRVVGQDQPGNARASLMQAEQTHVTSSAEIKIRVENNAHSQQEAIKLQWINSESKPVGPPTTVQVPAGQVRVVRMPPQPDGANLVRIFGDGWEGDNDVFVPSARPVRQQIVYCGSQATNDEENLSFFLSQAPLSSSVFRREVVIAKPSELSGFANSEKVVALVVEPVSELLSNAELIRGMAKRGVNVILVLSQQTAQDQDLASFLANVLEVDQAAANTLKITESESSQHSMIAFVDYRSIVFSSLADPRFNDFSKIRIWKHRRLNWPALEQTGSKVLPSSASSTAQLETLAKLDDGSVWLLRRSFGAGNIWLLTSGWQTSESSFALSSKFIPVMMNLIDPNPRQMGLTRTVDVGQAIDIEDDPPLVITNQLGQSVEPTFEGTRIVFDQPGLYSISGSRWNQQFAVQMAISESRLNQMDPAILQQYGLSNKRVQTEQEIVDRLRQMKIEELEQQQKIWKWLLVVGLAALLLETFLAGLATKKID